MHLPQVQHTMPTSQYKEQSRHCILEETEVHEWSTPSTFSLNGLNSSILFKSSINESRCGWFSNCWISLFTISLRSESSFWTVEWSIPLPRRVCSCLERRVSSYFALRSLWWSADVLASGSRGSWRAHCKFGVSTTRGNLGDWCTLEYKSSSIFVCATLPNTYRK